MSIFDELAQSNEQNKYSAITDTDFSEEENDGKNIFEQLASQKSDNFGFMDYLKDIAQQSAIGAVSGIGGAYGDILDLAGVQPTETLPGEQQTYSRQHELIQRLNRGEKLSVGELMELAEQDELPRYSKLPTTKEVRKGLGELTGIEEGKTAPGRIAGRGTEFLGSGIATGGGSKALATLGSAGIAGQSLREAGAPEGLATGTEIATMLTPAGITKKLLPIKGKEVVEAGKKIGMSDALITPLIQGEQKAATLSKIASKGERTKKIFGQIKESLGDSYNTIKSSPEAKKALPNSAQIKLRKDFGQIRNEMSKTLAPSPDRQAALDFIENSLDTLRNTNITPEYLVNFWQDINKSVKWNSIQGGKKALAELKQPILDILKNNSPKLAEDFELTNQLYSKYSQIAKKMKPDSIDAFLNKAEFMGTGAGLWALTHGNPWVLTGIASEKALRVLAREMLINPYFQNIGKKLVVNANQASLKGVESTIKEAQEYLKRKHPQEKWDFLTEKVED